MPNTLTIGRVAKRAEVNVETIRFYQRRGLLQEPQKPADGYRVYSADTVARIRFIKRAQVLGFTLGEVAELLQLDAACDCSETRRLTAHKVALVDRKIMDLTAIRDALASLVRQCDEAVDARDGCPVIHVLAQE